MHIFVEMIFAFTLMITFWCFVFHVLITCLNVVFIKTVFILVQVVSYTWLLCVCGLLLIYTHYMYLYNLVLMILIFTLVFLIFVHVFNFMNMLILSKTLDIHVYPRVTCFTCHVFHYGFFSCLDMYVHFSFDKRYIYLEVCLVFW